MIETFLHSELSTNSFIEHGGPAILVVGEFLSSLCSQELIGLGIPSQRVQDIWKCTLDRCWSRIGSDSVGADRDVLLLAHGLRSLMPVVLSFENRHFVISKLMEFQKVLGNAKLSPAGLEALALILSEYAIGDTAGDYSATLLDSLLGLGESRKEEDVHFVIGECLVIVASQRRLQKELGLLSERASLDEVCGATPDAWLQLIIVPFLGVGKNSWGFGVEFIRRSVSP